MFCWWCFTAASQVVNLGCTREEHGCMEQQMDIEVCLKDEWKLWEKLWNQTTVVTRAEAWGAGDGQLWGLGGHPIRRNHVCLGQTGQRRQLCRNLMHVRSRKTWESIAVGLESGKQRKGKKCVVSGVKAGLEGFFFSKADFSSGFFFRLTPALVVFHTLSCFLTWH